MRFTGNSTLNANSLQEVVIISQEQLNKTNKWTKKWRIIVNVLISFHLTMALRKGSPPLLKMGRSNVPQTSSFKYLGAYWESR